MIDLNLTLWEPDQCECGDDLFFEQAKNLPEGHIFEDSEMTCGDDSCDLISQVSFNTRDTLIP